MTVFNISHGGKADIKKCQEARGFFRDPRNGVAFVYHVKQKTTGCKRKRVVQELILCSYGLIR